jgi:hypothetical protein
MLAAPTNARAYNCCYILVLTSAHVNKVFWSSDLLVIEGGDQAINRN